jgi:hypothetical protein
MKPGSLTLALLAFLEQPESELKAVRQVGVDNMLLDLGVQVGDKMQQAEYIPPELIAPLGRLGMGLIFSVVQLPRVDSMHPASICY